jgi:hypothetical protein
MAGLGPGPALRSEEAPMDAGRAPTTPAAGNDRGPVAGLSRHSQAGSAGIASIRDRPHHRPDRMWHRGYPRLRSVRPWWVRSPARGWIRGRVRVIHPPRPGSSPGLDRLLDRESLGKGRRVGSPPPPWRATSGVCPCASVTWRVSPASLSNSSATGSAMRRYSPFCPCVRRGVREMASSWRPPRCWRS